MTGVSALAIASAQYGNMIGDDACSVIGSNAGSFFSKRHGPISKLELGSRGIGFDKSLSGLLVGSWSAFAIARCGVDVQRTFRLGGDSSASLTAAGLGRKTPTFTTGPTATSTNDGEASADDITEF
jgi:hypothetical protein